MAQYPPRPETPTLDALWAKYGIGASRYTTIRATNGGAGIEDAGLQIYYRKVDWKNEPADVSTVSAADVAAAEGYLKALDEVVRNNGGYLPGESPNEKPISQKDVDSPASAQATPAQAIPVPSPASAPPTPAKRKSFWQKLFGR